MHGNLVCDCVPHETFYLYTSNTTATFRITISSVNSTLSFIILWLKHKDLWRQHYIICMNLGGYEQTMIIFAKKKSEISCQYFYEVNPNAHTLLHHLQIYMPSAHQL